MAEAEQEFRIEDHIGRLFDIETRYMPPPTFSENPMHIRSRKEAVDRLKRYTATMADITVRHLALYFYDAYASKLSLLVSSKYVVLACLKRACARRNVELTEEKINELLTSDEPHMTLEELRGVLDQWTQDLERDLQTTNDPEIENHIKKPATMYFLSYWTSNLPNLPIAIIRVLCIAAGGKARKVMTGIKFTAFRPSMLALSLVITTASQICPDHCPEIRQFLLSRVPNAAMGECERCISECFTMLTALSISLLNPNPPAGIENVANSTTNAIRHWYLNLAEEYANSAQSNN